MEKVEMELKKIALLTDFRREMNGAVAGIMRDMHVLDGLQSYGVSLPTIKLICSSHTINHEFATYIYPSKVRELKLAATFLDDPTLVEKTQIEEWVADCDNREVLNSVAKLAAKSGVATELFEEWISSQDEKYRVTSLLIYGGVVKNGVDIADGLHKIVKAAQSCSKNEINPFVFALNAILSKHPNLHNDIKPILAASENIFTREIAEFF